MNKLIEFCINQKLVVLILLAFTIGWGVRVAPFDWDTGNLPRDPVAVDAIPDLGDNQQIVFTEYMGRSPQDVEDQISYPLTVSLLGIPGVQEVRSYSMFGLSYVYLIFKEDVDYYWSRSRILEKLNSLPSGLLPAGVTPALGPDATGLGQIYQYYLEGRDPDGNPSPGWNPEELRSIQDWYIRYALLGVEGVAEVSSVGGFVKQYQVEVDPLKLRAWDVTLEQVANAVRKSNRETGARNLAINGVEYILRGTGYITSLDDLRNAVVDVRKNTPVTVAEVATVQLGPDMRRGVIDVNGADAAGGIVVARFGANPLETIKNTKTRISELAASLPEKVIVDWTKTTRQEVADFAQQHGIVPAFGDNTGASTELNQDAWLAWSKTHQRTEWPRWMNTSKVTIVSFYDRSGLIAETLNTLNEALYQQILVAIIVVVIMVLQLRSSVLISSMLPLAVLIAFIGMKAFGVDANIVALSGIAIAIGTLVDVGIVLTENIVKRIGEAPPGSSISAVIYQAVTEVAGAVTTSVMTTIVSFLPVLVLSGEAGRLYRPLAYTKTFALAASIVVALTIIPPLAHFLMATLPRWLKSDKSTRIMATPFALKRRHLITILLAIGSGISLGFSPTLAIVLLALAALNAFHPRLPERIQKTGRLGLNIATALVVGWLLAKNWMPLGLDSTVLFNFLFVAIIIGGLLTSFKCFELGYTRILGWCLEHKALFLCLPLAMLISALCIWQGFGEVTSKLPQAVKNNRLYQDIDRKFPGLGKEFRPALDEGSFLVMPTISPHASIEEATDTLRTLDASIAAIPEVYQVVGKIGRAESALDPAPISMIETIVNYSPEFRSDAKGRIMTFKTDDRGDYVYDEHGTLIPDEDGKPFRQWRPHIRSTDDIWQEISRATQLTGTTGAPKLQPIETRLVMLRTGMRAPMGIKIKAPNLNQLEDFGIQLEQHMRASGIAGLDIASINADRIVGKPYLELRPDREAAKRYGLNVIDIQRTIQTAVGGEIVTTTVEGRERYNVLVRYARESRDSIEAIEKILVSTKEGAHVPLGEVVDVEYVRGPQVIKSEDTFLTGYVTFGANPGFAEVDVVEDVQAYLTAREQEGQLKRPGGVHYEFAGNYQSALEFEQKMLLIMPLALLTIFLILYLENRSVVNTFIIFSGIAVAFSGGFILLWLYGQPGFMNVDIFGHNLRALFNIDPVNLSTAIWVGFIALFGIATDDGVVISTYLRQSFARKNPQTPAQIRQATIAAGQRRCRPCLMTTATTLLALLPVLTSTGRGADIMGPMAVPIFGGMLFELLTMFVVPVLFCAWQERKRTGK
ncbi:MAG: efflux RND transporter permease subunit [Akkermansiaceae bacterium]